MKTFITGVIITFIYFLMISLFIWDQDLKNIASLNEFGDFLAGVFSPVAFLWLVLGFLQQQKELQQNTEALQLQAEELKNSVEQYKEMVSVSKQQLKNDAIRSLDEKMQREQEVKPDLYMSDLGWTTRSGNVCELSWEIKSDGREARNITLEFKPAIGEYDKFSFRNNNSSAIRLPLNKVRLDDAPEEFTVLLSYESILGYGYVSEYSYSKNSDGHYPLKRSADFQGSKI